MLYGLLGKTLAHSFSPPIHAQLADYDYQLFEMEEEALAAFVRRPDIGGLNVTIPYKQAVIPLCDALSPVATRIGSVNTLVYDDNRRITGHNTDYEGLCRLLNYAGIDPRGKKAAVLGNGGVCRTVRVVLEDMGARAVTVVSRTASDGVVTYADIDAYADAELVINTTPVGMYPHCPDAVLSLSRFPRCEGFVDMIYNPLRTAMMLEAEARGIPCCNGLPMLVAQAKAAAQMFTETTVSDDKIEHILRDLTAALSNVVLVGMPGCGKTAVGQALAKQTGRRFVDLDEEVVRATGRSIPALFNEGGETLFREWESRIIAEQGKLGGAVIATGGGAVLAEQNFAPLAQNGRIVWLTRPLEKLATAGRPLSTDRGALAAMYEARLPRYQRFAEITVSNDRPLKQTVADCLHQLEHAPLLGAPKGE
ncbi:MAG: AAA family ATPase [Ruminococcaceae bacterium]|nr:AAA family ATPase [Oscillospiraceae bacterium]